MCKQNHKRHAAPIQDALNDIRRPMRYGSRLTEPIARRTFAAVSRDWLKFIDKVVKILPKGDQEPRKDAHQLAEYKEFTDAQIRFGRDEFTAVIGGREQKKIDDAADEFINSAVGKSRKPQIDTNPANMDLMYHATVIAAGVTATLIAKKAWQKLSDLAKKNKPWVGGAYVYDPGMPWIRELYANGFQLVTDGVTKSLVPELKAEIVSLANAGTDWGTISRRIRDKFGEGKLWHWQRLVRTEMVISITETATRRYGQLGVGYLQWSLGNNACPICSGYRNQVNTFTVGERTVSRAGLWKMGTQPAIPFVTHPHCRCYWVPVFRI